MVYFQDNFFFSSDISVWQMLKDCVSGQVTSKDILSGQMMLCRHTDSQ